MKRNKWNDLNEVNNARPSVLVWLLTLTVFILILFSISDAFSQVVVTRPPATCIQTCSAITNTCITTCN